MTVCTAVSPAYLYFEGEHVARVVAAADALDARGHVQGTVPHARPVAHHPSLPDDPTVRVAPRLIEGVSAAGSGGRTSGDRGQGIGDRGKHITSTADGFSFRCTLKSEQTRASVHPSIHPSINSTLTRNADIEKKTI